MVWCLIEFKNNKRNYRVQILTSPNWPAPVRSLSGAYSAQIARYRSESSRNIVEMAAAIKDYIDLSQDDSCDFCDSDVDFQPESLKPIKYSSTLGKRKDTSKQIAKAVARDSKQAAKEREKEIKAQEKILQKQESGGFKNEEIALIMETNLSLSESIGALLLNFIQPEYHAFAYDFPLSGLCMWTHRRKLEGGFANINNESTRTLDFSVVLFDSDRFIQLITGGGHSVDFLDLRVEIDSMKATIAGFQDNGQSRMILVIRDFDKAANAKIKKKVVVKLFIIH